MARAPETFDQAQYDELLQKIDQKFKQRLEAIDGLQQIFEGQGEIFDALNKRIQEDTTLDEKEVVKELKDKLDNSKKDLLQGFTDLTDELSKKVDRETDTAKKSQIQDAIQKINALFFFLY